MRAYRHAPLALSPVYSCADALYGIERFGAVESIERICLVAIYRVYYVPYERKVLEAWQSSNHIFLGHCNMRTMRYLSLNLTSFISINRSSKCQNVTSNITMYKCSDTCEECRMRERQENDTRLMCCAPRFNES
jgi:hypothetical protein